MDEIKLENTDSYRDLAKLLKEKHDGRAKGFASGDMDHLYLEHHVCFKYNDLYIYLDPFNLQDMYITTEDVRYTPDGRRAGPYQQYLESGGKDSPEIYAANHDSISDVSLHVQFPLESRQGSTTMYIGDNDEWICFFNEIRSPSITLNPVGIDEYDLMSGMRFRTYIESTISSEAGFEEIIKIAKDAPQNQNINNPRFKREKGLYEKALRICESLRVILKDVNEKFHKEITPNDTQNASSKDQNADFESFLRTQLAHIDRYGGKKGARAALMNALQECTKKDISDAEIAEHKQNTTKEQRAEGGGPGTHGEQ